MALVLVGCMSSAEGDLGKRDAPATPPPTLPADQTATAPAQGWGDHIAWRHLEEGLAEARASHRPLMLVVHASWCNQCKKLKPAFQDRELSELTRHFVMVNADQDEVPTAMQYAPDGAYLPRIVFVAPETGEVDTSLVNTRRAQQRYFYTPRDDLVGTMRKALAAHGAT